MDIRFIQGQPVLVLEHLEGGTVRCCTISAGRGVPFEFIAKEDELTPEETNNSAGTDVGRRG